MEYFTRDNSLLRSERFRYHISRSADLLRGILKKMEPKCEKEKLTRNKYIWQTFCLLFNLSFYC